MQFQHVNVKIFTEGDPTVDSQRIIDVFHRWIKEQSLSELLIDVADYRHVPAGPGIVLVALEADYCINNYKNRYGLQYNRKAPLDGDNASKFCQALWSAANACQRLEEEFAIEGSLKFNRQEFEISINDRALAPNTPETYEACRPEIAACLKKVLGRDSFTLEHLSDPRSLFSIKVLTAQPFQLDEILQATS